MSVRWRREIKKRVAPLLPSHGEARREARRDRQGAYPTESDSVHLEETAAWLTRAQDAGSDAGVSRAYSGSPASSLGYRGWEPSYPETTGYIIPTRLVIGEVLDRPTFVERALAMADWEIAIQMDSGAVMGSVVTAPPSPAVFNTGQVIFGWLAAYRQSGQECYLDAARRAGDYLVSIQDPSGSWARGDSRFAAKGATVYNTRVAWAMALLGRTLRDETYEFSALALTLGLVRSGGLELHDAVAKWTVNPARIAGLPGGAVFEGKPADVILVDPDREWTVDPDTFLSRGKNTPFAGMKLRGEVVSTFVGGRMVYHRDEGIIDD